MNKTDNQIAYVMAKPVGAVCNLQCEYCYFIDRMDTYASARSVRMSDDVLEHHVRSTIDQYTGSPAPEIWFSWQGGEPTLFGLRDFRRIVALQTQLQPTGKTIRNAFQTNGMTIDDEWAEFFAKHDFLVGISIDGPAYLHDRYRIDRGGHPTHDRVIAGLRRLLAAGVKVNALTALNNQNVRDPSAVYHHLKGLGIEHIQFIPVVERQRGEGAIVRVPQLDRPRPSDVMTDWSVDPYDYGRFLCAVFDEWCCHDIGSVFVQGFEEHLGAWMGRTANLCIFAETCGLGPVLDHNGDVYSCDHYVYDEYRLGNILNLQIADMVRDPRQVEFGQDKLASLPADCLQCDYRFACHGGCPKHRLVANSGTGPPDNYLCPGYRLFFRHADPVFRYLAQSLQVGRSVEEIRRQLRHRIVGLVSNQGKIGRNDPCPCRSGRKFKQCCGR